MDKSFYEEITMKAITDTVEKLLVYPYGFHGDTGIRDYLYARLHVHGGESLAINDLRPGYSTLLLQSEHYTLIKYKNTGKTGKGARFDIALTLPPTDPNDVKARYAENLNACFAFELGKNKEYKKVIDPEMLEHNDDTIAETSDVSKLYRELKHHDLRQGWVIEFYDSRKMNGSLLTDIIARTLDTCKKIELQDGKKLVVIFVVFSLDSKHHVVSNNKNIQEALLNTLAHKEIHADFELSSNVPQQEELFVKGRHIIEYEGKICHLSCKGYSYSIRHYQNDKFGQIYGWKNNKEKYLALKNKIKIMHQAPAVPIEDTDFWKEYLNTIQKG